jgi:hypothetical protein
VLADLMGQIHCDVIAFAGFDSRPQRTWFLAGEPCVRDALSRLTDLGADGAARLVRRTVRDLGMRSIPAGAYRSTRIRAA